MILICIIFTYNLYIRQFNKKKIISYFLICIFMNIADEDNKLK